MPTSFSHKYFIKKYKNLFPTKEQKKKERNPKKYFIFKHNVYKLYKMLIVYKRYELIAQTLEKGASVISEIGA